MWSVFISVFWLVNLRLLFVMYVVICKSRVLLSIVIRFCCLVWFWWYWICVMVVLRVCSKNGCCIWFCNLLKCLCRVWVYCVVCVVGVKCCCLIVVWVCICVNCVRCGWVVGRVYWMCCRVWWCCVVVCVVSVMICFLNCWYMCCV